MIRERAQFEFRLISTHIFLLPALITISLFIKRDSFILVSVMQTILLLIIDFIWKISLNNDSDNSLYLLIALMLLLTYLVFKLINIMLVIFKEEKNKIEIEFPFKNGILVVRPEIN